MEIRELAISNCECKPIHIPGYIQPFGPLIATDKQVESITHVSSNVSHFLGVPASEMLGQPLTNLRTSKVIHTLRNVAGHPTIQQLKS